MPTLEPAHDGRRDFDFLHGRWRIANRRLDQRLQGGSSWSEFPSTAVVRPILGGIGNIDCISVPDLPGLGPFEGFTLRLFDPAVGRWSIFWASTASPGRLDPPLRGSFEGDRELFFGEDTHEGRPILVRFVWTRLGEDAARWEQSFSDDSGATWESNWVMQFTREVETA